MCYYIVGTGMILELKELTADKKGGRELKHEQKKDVLRL